MPNTTSSQDDLLAVAFLRQKDDAVRRMDHRVERVSCFALLRLSRADHAGRAGDAAASSFTVADHAASF